MTIAWHPRGYDRRSERPGMEFDLGPDPAPIVRAALPEPANDVDEDRHALPRCRLVVWPAQAHGARFNAGNWRPRQRDRGSCGFGLNRQDEMGFADSGNLRFLIREKGMNDAFDIRRSGL